MENKTGFNLNEALAIWREQNLAQPVVSTLDVNELESHLLDSVADLEKRGLSQEEAFWLAARRLGNPMKLSVEFAKANPMKMWIDRLYWMVLGVMIVQMWQSLVFSPLVTLAANHFGSGPVSQWVFGLNAFSYLAIAGIAFAVAKGYLMKPIRKISWCFGSQRQLAWTVSIWIFYLLTVHFASWLSTDRSFPSNFRWSLLSFLWPVTLGILAIWLANQKRASQKTELKSSY